MAKNKKQPTPVIKPSSSILAWLNQTGTGETPATQENEPAKAEEPKTVPIETTDVQQTLIDNSDEQGAEKGQSLPQPLDSTATLRQEELNIAPVVQENGQRKEIQESAIIGIEQPTLTPSKAEKNSPVRKKTGHVKAYADLFFTKLQKPDGEPDSKTIVRISEESHLLISILLENAKKQGNSLTIADFIDNLLADHRDKYREDVDKYIAQWRLKQRFL